jgi:nucleotide-binding universal stress UspA family protein
MTYKTILVHLDEHPRRSERLRLALRLAGTFGAHLTARFAMSTSFLPAYAVAEAGAAAIELVVENDAAAAAAAEQEFRAATTRSGVSAEWRAARPGYAFDPSAGGRCADLVIAGQPVPGDAAQKLFAGDLLLSAGRPVLFVPFVGAFSGDAKRVLVAWNGSREAARALADALPLLRRAGEVHVVTFSPAPTAAADADVALHLARHGVKVTLGAYRAPGLDIGEQLLSHAADLDADLIVMGAYGHSRVRERVLGGATRALLETMTVPVLMSH